MIPWFNSVMFGLAIMAFGVFLIFTYRKEYLYALVELAGSALFVILGLGVKP